MGFLYNSQKYADITVSTEKISQQTQQAKSLCEKLLSHIKIIENKVDTSCYIWSSDSSRLLYEYYKEDRIDCVGIREQLNLQIEHLNKIAAIYDNAEKASAEAVSALPDSIIN